MKATGDVVSFRGFQEYTAKATIALVAGILAMGSGDAWAVPYASGARNTGAANWEFVLNEAADGVTVLRDGGNALNLGALAAGRHSFDLSTFSTFSIEVSKSASPGWTAIHDPDSAFTRYEQPSDVIVNKDPSHPLFGTVYVNNDRTNPTASGRTMGDGVYSLTADLVGVDLPTRAAIDVGNVNDPALAKAPSWSVGQEGTDLGHTSAWRMTLDDAGNIIAGDWSNGNGGIKYAAPDLATGGLILANEDGILPLLRNGNNEEVHGSIVSRPYVTGSVGNNLTVYAIDEDLDPDGSSDTNDPPGPGNSLWRWNVGNATNYDVRPDLIIDAAEIAPTTDGRANYMSHNGGVLANALYSPSHNKWYLTENRADGNEAGLIVVTADGVDGKAPVVEWSSLQFSIDNALDGHTGVTHPSGGPQDIFRGMGGIMELSPDGTKLYIHRTNHSTVNPVLGTTSNAPGAVLILPLDEAGLPDLEVDAGAITNIDSITTASNTANGSRRGLSLDAAGNVYITNNVSERLEVFSPGGDTLAVTSFDTATMTGDFDLGPLNPVEDDADFDGDGDVDGQDFLTWQRGLGVAGDLADGDADGSGFVDGDDLAVWRDQFGPGAPATPSAGAVPEPSTWALAALACAACIAAAAPHRRAAVARAKVAG